MFCSNKPVCLLLGWNPVMKERQTDQNQIFEDILMYAFTTFTLSKDVDEIKWTILTRSLE